MYQSRPQNRLFDHLVGERQYLRGNIEVERLGGRQIDDESELGRLLNREIARFCSAQNFVDKVASAAELVGVVGAISDQTSRIDMLAPTEHRRQARGERQRIDADPVGMTKGSAAI